jgi:hypothetical protein
MCDYVGAFCHTTYQYNNPIQSKHTGACPRQHSCDFSFLRRYGRVFVSSLPVSVNNLKQCITTAVVSVGEDML